MKHFFYNLLINSKLFIEFLLQTLKYFVYFDIYRNVDNRLNDEIQNYNVRKIYWIVVNNFFRWRFFNNDCIKFKRLRIENVDDVFLIMSIVVMNKFRSIISTTSEIAFNFFNKLRFCSKNVDNGLKNWLWFEFVIDKKIKIETRDKRIWNCFFENWNVQNERVFFVTKSSLSKNVFFNFRFIVWNNWKVIE